jgi:hypothetical protein
MVKNDFRWQALAMAVLFSDDLSLTNSAASLSTYSFGFHNTYIRQTPRKLAIPVLGPQIRGALSVRNLLTLIMVSAMVLLGSPSIAVATSCSSSGGQQVHGQYGYYEASVVNVLSGSNILRYGVKAGISASGWTYNSGGNGHSLLFVDIQLTSDGKHWAQAGVGRGLLDGQTASAREMYFEYTNGAGTVNSSPYNTGYTIPDSDSGSAWTFAYQTNADGTYTFELGVSSPSNSVTVTTHPNVGAFYAGPVYGTTENAYFNSYSGSCNGVTQNTLSSLSYPNTITTSPTWNVWPNGNSNCSGFSWTPYSVDISSCPTTVTESGN